MLEEAQGDTNAMEEKLGLDEGSLGDNPQRVDVYNPEDYNLREPDSSMAGANENYVEGGETSGGMPEGVVDPFPNSENNEKVGEISSVKEIEPEEVYGASGDGYDHIGGSSGISDKEFADSYVDGLGTNGMDMDFDIDGGISM